MYDRIIIGAGLYGLYAALHCGKRGEKVLVIECEEHSFMRATYINQARVHMGYHYPRSLSTAIKSAGYYRRFLEDYEFSIHDTFEQIYATSGKFSWTDAKEFRKFCRDAKIRCEDVAVNKYFNEGMCDGAFLTEECTYDAHILRDYFLVEISKYANIILSYQTEITKIEKGTDRFCVYTNRGTFESDFVLNATYASTNQILNKVIGEKYAPFSIKYELCEVILCKVNSLLEEIGITVMDGPFFSIMPFGRTGYHSLTSVTFTPHMTSYQESPKFACQQESGSYCTPEHLGNCNTCPTQPESAWNYMSQLARKYLRSDYQFTQCQNLFSMKPILKAAEIDDSRPTVVRIHATQPTMISVLSGKINTVYDLDEYLCEK